MATYTPPTGLTPQGQDLANMAAQNAAVTGVNQAQQPTADAAALIAQAQTPTSGLPMQPQVNAATQNLAGLMTPEYKSNFIQNQTMIPQQSQNYQDLIKQLAAADVTNFGYKPTPGGAPAEGLPGGLPLSPYLGYQLPSISSANPTIPTGTSPDPFSAMNLKLEQGKNMVDLLDILNTAIGREFTTKTGVYASKIAAAALPLKVALQEQQTQNEFQRTKQQSIQNYQMMALNGFFSSPEDMAQSWATATGTTPEAAKKELGVPQQQSFFDNQRQIKQSGMFTVAPAPFGIGFNRVNTATGQTTYIPPFGVTGTSYTPTPFGSNISKATKGTVHLSKGGKTIEVPSGDPNVAVLTKAGWVQK